MAFMRKKVLNQSIKVKIGIFIIAVVSALIVSLCFDFFVVEYTSSDDKRKGELQYFYKKQGQYR